MKKKQFSSQFFYCQINTALRYGPMILLSSDIPPAAGDAIGVQLANAPAAGVQSFGEVTWASNV